MSTESPTLQPRLIEANMYPTFYTYVLQVWGCWAKRGALMHTDLGFEEGSCYSAQTRGHSCSLGWVCSNLQSSCLMFLCHQTWLKISVLNMFIWGDKQEYFVCHLGLCASLRNNLEIWTGCFPFWPLCGHVWTNLTEHGLQKAWQWPHPGSQILLLWDFLLRQSPFCSCLL